MTFTPVVIKRGSDGLAVTEGYWSNKRILISTSEEPTIHLLDTNATCCELINSINSFIDRQLPGWLTSYYKGWIPSVLRDKFRPPYFSIQGVPGLSRPEWMTHKKISVPKLIASLQTEGKNIDEISGVLVNAWLEDWRIRPDALTLLWGLPDEIALSKILFIPWSKIDDSASAESFLKDLSNIAEMDLSPARFNYKKEKDGPHRWSSNQLKIQGALTQKEMTLLDRYGVGDLLGGSNDDMKKLLYVPQTASLALALLAKNEKIIISRYLPGNQNAAVTELGMQTSFSTFEHRATRASLSGLLMSSNIRTLEDIPYDLRDHFNGDGAGHLWKPLRKLLIEHGDKFHLSPFDVSSFERGSTWRKDVLKWTPDWFVAEKRSEEWCEFAACAFDTCAAGVNKKIEYLRALGGWALGRFESPWDIKTIDIRNPAKPKDPDSFFEYCRQQKRDSYNLWADSSLVFKQVVQAASIPNYPWYRPNATSPFNNISNPFSSASHNSRNNGKTSRARMATVIHEELIEVLLDLDSDGKPTFEWARNCMLRSADTQDGVWCPSRWTLLALLLLLPLRKKQARWLDQGLMDEMVFDPETFQMIQNDHHLKNFKYADGKSHFQLYGRPSGAIQPITHELMGVTGHMGIFVNTNKTQLWNPRKHNGYELPWPDGSELLASSNDELRDHGKWLRRVYEVLAYQYRFVSEHDPNPVPVTFYDTPDDKGLVTQHEHIKDSMPYFVPLFRDTTDPKQVRRDKKMFRAYLPMSPFKILSGYTALCMEVETRLHAKGFKAVRLTVQNSKGKRSDDDVAKCSTNNPKFDIHCLRVAGISRLIEMDIDPVIVQEFVAGHLTPAMTHRYIKLQPWHVRERIIEAIVNGDFRTQMDAYAEKVAKGGGGPTGNFASAPRFREHINDLPEDFSSFAVVEGGICTMGGKGDACDQGGVYERNIERNDEIEVYYGPVRGGCGNCRFFRSAGFLINEQALYLDMLMADLRALAKQRTTIRTKITDLTCLLDECEDLREQARLNNDLSLFKGRLEDLNHNMVPAIAEWVNRYQVLLECEAQMEDDTSTALVGPFDAQSLTPDDVKVELEMTTDIGLMARIIEKARILECRGIAIPDKPGLMLEQAVDKILRMIGSNSLLLDVTSKYRTRGASMIYNLMEDMIGSEKIQEALDTERPLSLPANQRDALNQFAAAVVATANTGSLTIDGALHTAGNYTLLNSKEAA